MKLQTCYVDQKWSKEPGERTGEHTGEIATNIE